MDTVGKPQPNRPTHRRWHFIALFGISVIGGYLLFNKTPTSREATITAPQPVSGSNHRLTLPIVIDTAGQTINAAEIYLKFDPKVVQVDSISKDQTFFTIWVPNEPKFSNTSGDISFVGGIFNPGFRGQGKVGSVTLVAKKPLKTKLTFTGNTAVKLNDGLGTSIPLQLKPIEVDIK